MIENLFPNLDIQPKILGKKQTQYTYVQTLIARKFEEAESIKKLENEIMHV